MRLSPLSARLAGLGLAALLSLAPAMAPAQGLYSPRVYVNNAAVTQYELDQRMRFMQELGASGDVEQQALDALIDDRLYQAAAKAAKITVTDAQVEQGIADFAARGNLTVDEFRARMRGAGISDQTLRDFVRSGLMWRDVVRGRFAGKVQITNAEIDRALSAESIRPGMEIALSEIILPMIEPYREQSQQIAQLIQQEVHGPDLFAEAARRFSASSSRERGGALDWMPAGRLPPMIAGKVAEATPGQIIGPIEVPNAMAFFMLRGRREGARPDPASLTVDYAELHLPAPDAAAEAARLDAGSDSCDDLYALTGLQPGTVQRQSATVRTLPADVALELARLDPGESSTRPMAGGGLRFLMLCARTPHFDQPPSRDQVRARLLDERVGGLAKTYLAELRANAIIRRP